MKIDEYMLRGVWQALNCLFIHATFCVIAAGASPGQTKMKAGVHKINDFFCNCGSNNWETVVDMTADTLNAPYLPKAKAYELQTW